MQDGSFGILGVPVNAGDNVLTAMVQDVSGNTATQFVNFTVGNSQSTTFSYDANGNLSGVGVSPAFTYSYDAENRITTVTSNGVTVLECWYDGAGHRIAKREIINGQTNTVQYVWDNWELLAVLGGDGALKEFYTRGIAATYYVNGLATATIYLWKNDRGDVIMARQGTNTVATMDYTPYGEVRSKAGSYAPRFSFSSKEFDMASGFYHFPYRYYAPQWARWITRDPIASGLFVVRKDDLNSLSDLIKRESLAFVRSLDAYAYTGNNAMMRTDPLGLSWSDCFNTCWNSLNGGAAGAATQGCCTVAGLVGAACGATTWPYIVGIWPAWGGGTAMGCAISCGLQALPAPAPDPPPGFGAPW
jgi:RHS repeat-associated protein